MDLALRGIAEKRAHVGEDVQRHIEKRSIENPRYDVSENHLEHHLCRSKSFNDGHGPTTLGTSPTGADQRDFRGANDGCHSEPLAAEFKRCGSPVVRHEAEVSDADERLRQHVDQEAADELIGGNSHQGLLITSSVIPPTERDIAAIEGHQSVIGDGDAVRVASQVTKNLFRSAEGSY